MLTASPINRKIFCRLVFNFINNKRTGINAIMIKNIVLIFSDKW
jgi:hypothetical protein